MFNNFVILYTISPFRCNILFIFKKCTVLFLIFYSCCSISNITQNNTKSRSKHILQQIPFCNGFKIGSSSLYFNNFDFNVSNRNSNSKSHTYSSRYSLSSDNNPFQNNVDDKITETIGIPEDSTNKSAQQLGSEPETDVEPGKLTDSEIWKMKAAISQNSTLGIDWLKTIETLQTSPNCKVSPLTIAYNSALSAAEKNCNADLSLEIISDMKKTDKKSIDSVSYKLAIMSCVKANRVQEAINLHEEALGSGFTLDHGTIRSLLWLLSFNGYGQDAIKLFEILKKVSELCKNEKGLIQKDYLYTIESCLLSNMFGDALEIYKQLKKSGKLSLDFRSMKTLLELAYNLSDSQMCMDLYTESIKEKTFELSYIHFKLILNTLLFNRNFDLVDKIWKNMLGENVLLDRILCQLVLESYSNSGNYQKAYDLLILMDRERLLNTSQPYELAIKSCEKCGEWKLALKILRMAQNKLENKDIKLYNGVLEVCNTAREWDSMISLYQEILREGTKDKNNEENKKELQPDGDTIAYMIISYYNLEDQKQIDSLLSIPVVDTPLLSKIRKSLKQQQ